MKKKLAYIAATYFGCGLSKHAPGTCGSLGTLPLAYALLYFGGLSALLIAAVMCFVIGVWATKIVVEDCGDSDPSKVVIDETVGQLITFSLIAYLDPEYLQDISSLLLYLLGFGFFRFFDILKMGPVKYADTKIKNAYGVMLDDVFAGIFAAIILLLSFYGLTSLDI